VVALKSVAGVLIIALILIGALPFYLMETVLNMILVQFNFFLTLITTFIDFIANVCVGIVEAPFNFFRQYIMDSMRAVGLYIYIPPMFIPRSNLTAVVNLGVIDFGLMGINKQFSPIGFMMAFFLPVPQVANTIGLMAVIALVIGIGWLAFSVPKVPSNVVSGGKQWFNRRTYKIKRYRYRRRKLKQIEKRYGKKWRKKYKRAKKW
jgi:hypothetical protein